MPKGLRDRVCVCMASKGLTNIVFVRICRLLVRVAAKGVMVEAARERVQSTAISRQLREESLGREEPGVRESCGGRTDCESTDEVVPAIHD